MTDSENNNASPQTGSFASGDSNSFNGEYRYTYDRNAPCYSDAHYVPAGDSTVPPRYYVPNQRYQAQRQEKKQEQPVDNASSSVSRVKKIGIVPVICLCAFFSVLGGIIGAFLMKYSNDSRFDELETRISELEPSVKAIEAYAVGSAESSAMSLTDSAAEENDISPSMIYDIACSQVVGITTEVTYTNFFGMSSSSAVTGTGFAISEDGYIATNYHVIESDGNSGYSVSVITHDGAVYDAEIVGADPDNDLAVLKIQTTGLHPITMANSDEIKVGDAAYAVGNPLGELEFTMTSGTVTALDRLISSNSYSVPINMFQIDAAVNSGNSGGPVYNSNGDVIGIVTAKYSSNGVEGIGFAIPINDADRIIEELINNGYVTGKACLGIYYDENSNSIYNRYYRELWNSPRGVLVMQVAGRSCADRAGIISYDIITAIDGKPVESCAELVSAIKNYSAGDKAVLTIYRTGETAENAVKQIEIIFDEYVPGFYKGAMSVA